MSQGNPNITTFSKLAYGTAGGSLPATQLIDYRTAGAVGLGHVLADGNGTRGELSRYTNRVRKVQEIVAPSFSFQPTVAEIGNLLQWSLYGTPTGSTTLTYPLANSPVLEPWQLLADNGDGTTTPHNYPNLAVSRIVFRTGAAEPLLTVDLQCLGIDHETSTSFPSLTNLDNTTAPFALIDTSTAASGTVSLGGTVYPVWDLSLTVDNLLDASRFANSLRLTKHTRRDRLISVSFQMTAQDADAVRATSPAGVATVITFENGAKALTFTLPAVIYPLQPNDYGNREEVRPTVTGTAYRTTGSEALVTTLTP